MLKEARKKGVVSQFEKEHSLGGLKRNGFWALNVRAKARTLQLKPVTFKLTHYQEGYGVTFAKDGASKGEAIDEGWGSRSACLKSSNRRRRGGAGGRNAGEKV